MEKVNFWEISNCDNMTHSIGPYYDSNNCLMSQFQKSTLKFAWTLFQDHVIMLSKSTVRDGRPCRLILFFMWRSEKSDQTAQWYAFPLSLYQKGDHRAQ